MTFKIKKSFIVLFFFLLYVAISTSFSLLIGKTITYDSKTDQILDLLGSIISYLMEALGVLLGLAILIEIISAKTNKEDEH